MATQADDKHNSSRLEMVVSMKKMEDIIIAEHKNEIFAIEKEFQWKKKEADKRKERRMTQLSQAAFHPDSSKSLEESEKKAAVESGHTNNTQSSEKEAAVESSHNNNTQSSGNSYVDQGDLIQHAGPNFHANNDINVEDLHFHNDVNIDHVTVIQGASVKEISELLDAKLCLTSNGVSQQGTSAGPQVLAHSPYMYDDRGYMYVSQHDGWYAPSLHRPPMYPVHPMYHTDAPCASGLGPTFSYDQPDRNGTQQFGQQSMSAFPYAGQPPTMAPIQDTDMPRNHSGPARFVDSPPWSSYQTQQP